MRRIIAMPYQEDVAYKGLQNVGPVNYANNLFMLPPGFKVIVEAEIADKIYESQYPTFAYLDPEEVDAIIAEGRIDLKEVFGAVTTAEKTSDGGEVTQNPPAQASSDVADVSLPGSDAPAEEALTSASASPNSQLEQEVHDPQEFTVEEIESPEISTEGASTSLESSPETTSPKPNVEGPNLDLPKRPKLNRDK
jgi:hypothetical protein